MSIGNQRIVGAEKITGLQIGHVYIQAAGVLTVDGLVLGNITIAAGASLNMNGLLIGDLIDQGGYVNVAGLVLGKRSKAEPGGKGEKVINPDRFLPNAKTQASVKSLKHIK